MPHNPHWSGWLKLFLCSATAYGAAVAARYLLVPDIVPIGLADAPQSLWAVPLAFVLRAIELTAGYGILLLLIAALGKLLHMRRPRPRAVHSIPPTARRLT